jgi:predicted RNase H-like nuclease (RuvC/YqgF family)
MEAELAKIERRSLSKTGKDRRTAQMRVNAAQLRRDIDEAEMHIDRLRRRYLRISDQPPPKEAGRA